MTLCIVLGGLFYACSDEMLEDLPGAGGVDKNRMVEVKVPFGIGQGMTAHIETRAPKEPDQFGKDSQLSGIMVFVYENNGGLPSYDKRLSFQLFESPLTSLEGSTGGWMPSKDDLTQGYFKLYLPVGDMFIYLIGNAQGSFGSFFPELGDNKLETRADFLNMVRPKWNGNMFAVDGFLPLAGTVNNRTGACTVTESETAPGTGVITYKDDSGKEHTIGQYPVTSDANNSFILQRLMCKVSMEFKSGPNGTFTPKSYKFYHCPEYISPTEEAWEGHSVLNTIDTETVPFDAQTPNSFTVYLPENRRIYNRDNAPDFPETLTFGQRDEVKKDESGQNQSEDDGQGGHELHYDFKYAPKYSTYVEIIGEYEGKDGSVSADTRYLLHLGDFSNSNFNEFSLKRDHHYHYTVTVNGVNDIEVEVLGENSGNPYEKNPAAEGIVFKGGARLQLDAHYEQVEMKLSKSDLGQGVYIYAQTPFGMVNCKYLPANGSGAGRLDDTHPNTPNTLDGAKKLLQWLEFKKQDRKGVLASYAPGQRMDVFAALDDANTGTGGYYTCFVDEYYYTENPINSKAHVGLSDFVNAEDRTFSLGSGITYSADGKSAVASAVYVLQQHSIACFYDLSNTTVKKYGVEVIDEIGDVAQKPLPYGTPAQEGTSDKLGRKNTLVEIGSNTDAVNWEQNGYLLDGKDLAFVPGEERLKIKSAHLACLTRNRDFDGNGSIEEKELRWYTPARDQVLGLWIGEPALPTEAALYPKPTSELKGDASTCQWPVFTSTNGENRVIWAEQGCSFGTVDAAEKGGYVRVVRNLGATPSEDSDTLLADPYYSYDGTNRTIEVYLTGNALRAFSNRELAPHHERSVINRPYKKFQVAAHPYVLQNVEVTCSGHGIFNGEETKYYTHLQTTDERRAKTDITTIASKYVGNESDINNIVWRLPNQREMALMIVAMGTDLDYTNTNKEYNHWDYKCKGDWRHRWEYSDTYILHCRTSFSIENYSPGFLGYMYNTKDKKMQMMHDTGGAGVTGIAGYLCVRDVQQ